MLETTLPHLPDHKPHYLMGVGTPDDIMKAVARGIDMFDCVMPTRSGRHCQAFTWNGKLNLRNARYADDPTPLLPEAHAKSIRDVPRDPEVIAIFKQIAGADALPLR